MKIPTLSILRYIEKAGLGVIDENLFWESMALDQDGIYINSLGQAQRRGNRKVYAFELYSRAHGKLAAYQQLRRVRELLAQSFNTCTLPAVEEYDADEIKSATVALPSEIMNVGVDAAGHALFSVVGQVTTN